MGILGHVSKSEFKAKALEYLRRVEASGEELIITDRGTPVIRVLPVRPRGDDARAKLRGALVRYDEPTEPVGVEDWDSLA
jgi:prevent-host-death family protein